MEINWIVIAIVLVSVIGIIIYLIIRDQKDKNEMIRSLNKTDEDPKPKGKVEN